MLSPKEQAKLAELRGFLATEIAPYAADWWNKAEFPAHILPKLAALELSTPAQRGYSNLFAGLVIAEMTRVDTSIATFFLVHHDLFVESLYGFGSADQKERLLADAASLRITGAFALTEPGHGSDVAGGMETRARRISSATGESDDDGDTWVLNGAKRWIGNGTFCDHLLVWAREETVGGAAGRGAVRGFIVDASLPGVTRSRIENKIALRTVQNADIVFEDVRVPEADRFAGISSFEDTNQLLRGSRIMVAWQAVGQQLAAFDVARQYAVERHQFGRPLAKFQLIQQQLVTMLGNAVAGMGMMVRIAQLQDAGAADMAQVALAKSYTSARMRETVALGRSILGGNGIVTDYRMAKIFSDAEAIYTYEGSFEINTLIVGRAVTGVSAIV
ncbi:acyl-CoA dehydrogenase family protein [Arthrobacter sp. HMWF013]|uniref:acyl-CoA dehydrogenase family protein n=1 Tax=Arthrobacter sp. HMWF013 TaxID=2056849 RepID=UPI000D38322B|nr:acyl-CoA dehydrogenase family protein [Arthrobacter sp. HMWF013]PTT61979.1 acyl-CoA dehydrogenase [Arthrobacter sp. HMWF013]